MYLDNLIPACAGRGDDGVEHRSQLLKKGFPKVGRTSKKHNEGKVIFRQGYTGDFVFNKHAFPKIGGTMVFEPSYRTSLGLYRERSERTVFVGQLAIPSVCEGELTADNGEDPASPETNPFLG